MSDDVRAKVEEQYTGEEDILDKLLNKISREYFLPKTQKGFVIIEDKLIKIAAKGEGAERQLATLRTSARPPAPPASAPPAPGRRRPKKNTAGTGSSAAASSSSAPLLSSSPGRQSARKRAAEALAEQVHPGCRSLQELSALNCSEVAEIELDYFLAYQALGMAFDDSD